MKKTYIKPAMKAVHVTTTRFIAASGKFEGTGIDMRISNEEATGEAESRGGGSLWDDED